MQPVFCRSCYKSAIFKSTSKTSQSAHSWFTQRGIYLDSHTAWLVAELLCTGLLHFRESSLFFIGRGIWLLSCGSRPVSNACLPCKQAAGSAASCSQCAMRPGWAQPSCDTDPTPIAPWQPALIDPSNTLTSIYILFVTGRVCCAHTHLCTVSLNALRCVWACACVWLGHLYCSQLTWIPFSPSQESAGAGLSF